MGDSIETNKLFHHCPKCDWKFDDVGDFNSHISQDYCTSITNLDVKCLENIFKFMSPNDLVEMSLTCKHYKAEAERYFSLKQDPNIEPIEIRASREHIDFYFDSERRDLYKYHRYFRHLIRSVRVAFYRTAPLQNVFEFIQNNCAANFTSLRLRVHGGLLHDSPIEGQIQWQTAACSRKLVTLTYLELVNIPGFDLHEQFLIYCGENLKTLIITHSDFYPGVRNCRYGDAWLNQTYPNLEILRLEGFISPRLDLSNLLHLNPNIKSIYCDTGNVQAVNDICKSKNPLNNFAIAFSNAVNAEIDNLETDHINLSLNNIECFDVSFLTSCTVVPPCAFRTAVDTMLKMENLKVLHLHEHAQHILDDNPNFVAPNVEVLCIRIRCEQATMKSSERLAHMFPNLCKLVQLLVNCNRNTNSSLINNNCFAPVANYPKLNSFKLLLSYSESSISVAILGEVDTLRAHLENFLLFEIHVVAGHFKKCLSFFEDERFIVLKPKDFWKHNQLSICYSLKPPTDVLYNQN